MPGPDPRAPTADPSSRVWITLITRATYLPGVALLVHTLYKQQSKHPILVQYTSALSEDCIQSLHTLAALYPLCRPHLINPISLPQGLKPVATRFNDTLTKLRAFEPIEVPHALASLGLEKAPEQICFLDADIMIFRNIDDIFDIPRPGPDWISAYHACVCNVDSDPWAPPEWNVENCPGARLVHPSALDAPIPEPESEGQKITYKLLNSGVFVATPSRELWNRMEEFRLNDPRCATFTFPDQHFLDVFFEKRWVPIGWQYNASKTNRYWHKAAWRDEEVRALHYIVDKPWEKRIGEDGVAGYRGRDGVTHSWWWKEYDAWEVEMEEKGGVAVEMLNVVRQYVGKGSELNDYSKKEAKNSE